MRMRGAGVLLLVEHEVPVVAPLREEALLEAGALDPLEPVGRDDLVGVDVGAVERHGGAGDDAYGFHDQRSSRGGEVAGDGRGGGDGGGDEVGAPAAALAALEVAVAGGGAALAAARACRGSWPGTSSSPGSRQSKPASVKILSRPSASACSLTGHEPGTTSVRMPDDDRAALGDRRPRPAGPRCGRWCSEPMNTVSTADLLERGAGGEAHVLERPLGGVALGRVGEGRRVGDRRRDRGDLAGVGAPGDVRRDLGGVERRPPCRRWRRRRWGASSSRRRRRPRRRPWARGRGPRGSRRWSGRGR